MFFCTVISAVCVFAAPQKGAECATICPANYDPVCASDSTGTPQTFGNQCGLNAYNCMNGKSK